MVWIAPNATRPDRLRAASAPPAPGPRPARQAGPRRGRSPPRVSGGTPMPWLNQHPPAEDVVIVLRPHGTGAGYIEVDRLPDGAYRATHGSAFGCIEVGRTADLEGLLRELNEALWCET